MLHVAECTPTTGSFCHDAASLRSCQSGVRFWLATHLCWPVQLEQKACLAGEQVLAEVELSYAVAAHDAAAGLTPSSLQKLCSIIAICFASCNRQWVVASYCAAGKSHAELAVTAAVV